MNSDFKNNDYIEDNNDYLNEFNNDSTKENRKVVQALKVALDTRKFEIELYWKRATYFWAFIATSFTAYFLLLNSNNIANNKFFTIIISLIGYLFSLGWYFVNCGSKYWQENWEQHVANLEQPYIGTLFEWCKVPEKIKFWQILKGVPMSVTRVNQFLSFSMVIFWFFLFIYSLLFSYDKIEKMQEWLTFENKWFVIVGWGLFIIVLSLVFFKTTKSFIPRNIDKELTREQRKYLLFMRRKRN